VRLSLPTRAFALVAFAALVVALNAYATPSNAAAQPQKVCGPAGVAMARCHALLSMNGVGQFASTSPTGLSPATIKSAYNFSTSSTAGAGKTIAIVDAFDDPSAESDLAVFSNEFGLPACTTAYGCFS
jgi:subtilase family serine protease